MQPFVFLCAHSFSFRPGLWMERVGLQLLEAVSFHYSVACEVSLILTLQTWRWDCGWSWMLALWTSVTRAVFDFGLA